MTVEEVTLALFTFCNSIRIFGYLPQLLRSTRDKSGGSSTSVTTWTVFFAANASTAAYVIVHARDSLMALMFSLNALCCVFIVMVTLWKREQRRRRPPERARRRNLQPDGGAKIFVETGPQSSVGADVVNTFQQRQRIGMRPPAVRSPSPDAPQPPGAPA